MADDICFSSEIQAFVDTYTIVSCKQTQQVYVYNQKTGIFIPVDEIEISKLVDEYIDSGMSALDWSDTNMSVIMKYIKTKAPYYETMGRPGRIVFNNGTFHLKDMKLHKHSPKDRAISRLPVDYDPDATCPIFEQFVAQMADGNSNLEKTLFEISSYVAMGSRRASKLAILVSVGGSGKSVYLRTLELLVGKAYTSNLSISEINNPTRAFDRCALLESRLNIVHELGEKETLNSIFSANVKKIVSGEEISCEKKFGARISFVPRISMIVIASNHCPIFERIPSESIRRRFIILNITRTFSFAEQDPDLFEKIKTELAGIFNKALEYYRILEEDNFVFASEEESRQFIDQQIIETFPMYQFVTKHVVAKPGHKLSNTLLRQKYTEWANEHEIDVTVDTKSLMKMLANTIKACHFPFTRGKNNGERYLQGIDYKE